MKGGRAEGGGGCRRRALRNAWGGGVPSSVTKRYKGVGGVKFSGKKRYVTLEWPL